MELLLLGAGMGVAGGLVPSPLHLIALTQVAVKRWKQAVLILLCPPLLVDGILLVATLFFYRLVPHHIARWIAYAGGITLVGIGSFSLYSLRRKGAQEFAESKAVTYGSITAACLAEVTAPGTWIYWVTIAGPILAEGKRQGYGHVAPFFVGGLAGYYGAALLSLWLLALGAGLHRKLKQQLAVVTNILLLVLGISYLLRALLGK